MKKDRKRQIRRYDDYCWDCRIHYGVFKLHGKLAVDPKRLLKIHLLSYEQYRVLSAKPRSTQYYYPQYKNYTDCIFGVVEKTLDDLQQLWKTEFEPLEEQILTPEEYANRQETKRYCNIVSPDDIEDFAFSKIMDRIHRTRPYYLALLFFNVQFFLLYFACVENLVLKICRTAGYSKEKLYNEEKNNFILDHIDSDVIFCDEYEGLRILYNLLKHGSRDNKADYKNKTFCKFFDIEKYKLDTDLAILSLKHADCLIKTAFGFITPYVRDLCEKLNKNTFDNYKLECEEYFLRLVQEAKTMCDY